MHQGRAPTSTCPRLEWQYCYYIHSVPMYNMYIPSCHAGLNVTEVAHDLQQQVARFVTVQLGVVNSFDTWHGMINAHLHIILYSFEFSFVSFIRDEECGQRKKITEGLVRNRGITWFPNLIDKRKTQWSAYIHVYVHPHSVGVQLMEATCSYAKK